MHINIYLAFIYTLKEANTTFLPVQIDLGVLVGIPVTLILIAIIFVLVAVFIATCTVLKKTLSKVQDLRSQLEALNLNLKTHFLTIAPH